MKFNPDEMSGFFGEFGGRYVDESLISELEKIEEIKRYKANKSINIRI